MKFSTTAFFLLSLVASGANGFDLHTTTKGFGTKKQLNQQEFLKFLEESATDHAKLRKDPIYQLKSSLDDLKRKSAQLSQQLNNKKEWPSVKRLEDLKVQASTSSQYYEASKNKLRDTKLHP